MESESFPLWGGTAVVAAAERPTLDRALPLVRDTLSRFDEACSRFRADSELSRLNRGELIQVSELLFSAVEQALRAARLTGGDVDPTVGRALVGLGYDGEMSEGAEVRRVRFSRVPGWQVVRLHSATRSVILPPGVQLDLGATAKALAADCCAASASACAGGAGVLVSLGGDVATSGIAPEGGWRIRVTDDHRAGTYAPGQWITIRGGGLASSSTTVRRWRSSEGELHHIVDPRTGAPAEETWRTVSVTAACCLDANIASTAAILSGSGAPGWLERLHLPSRLVSREGRALHVAGWPAQEDDLA